MAIPRFKRKPSGMEYVDNAFHIQVEVMNLASKLSARWSKIYLEPIDSLACKQADLINMANSINPKTAEDFITRRWLMVMSRSCLSALEKRVMDMIRILYMNPSRCFSRKNGKNYTRSEATILLDKKLEELGVSYEKQYSLIKRVLASDEKKYNKVKNGNVTDKEIIEILISKGIDTIFRPF